MVKTELEPKQIVNFVGYQFDFKEGKVRQILNRCETLKSLEDPKNPRKDDTDTKIFHPLLKWWLQEANVLQSQPLHPLGHALQIFVDASKEAKVAPIGYVAARGPWSLPESKLCINYLLPTSSKSSKTSVQTRLYL